MDNRYSNYGCPALMQDARFITNYLPSRTIEQYVRHINDIGSAQDYKLFLQKNGDVIMNRERDFMNKTNTCGVHGKCVSINDGPYETIVNFEMECNGKAVKPSN